MRTPELKTYETRDPEEFIETHGPSLDEEQQAKTD